MRHRRSRAGFTLIEVVISFVLIVLIIGVGVLSLATESARKQITKPAGELKKYARRGLQMAINQRRAFSIQLTPGSFVLREGAMDAAGEDRFDSLSGERFDEAVGDEEPSGMLGAYQLDELMTLEVRRWGEKFFRKPEGDAWVFEPSGICEPIGIKLIHEKGFIEMEFNPLTAKIQDQSLVIGGKADRDF
ncbi:MAG: prepilin-type N-terminal cleavage/methylation domain-containing protein [Verrucomicrobiales bacterium]|nr:prepilin-type N-terminal cleavage/methylation domain-containing protein [Verrucomicrobiales bacterium]MED5586833.1 prepilin-type N-terminal cleavage/methylation domain-containing protein [Verrucomicrobiota bacterium]